MSRVVARAVTQPTETYNYEEHTEQPPGRRGAEGPTFIAVSWTGLTGSTPRICLRWQAPAEQESATQANIFHSPFPQGAGVRPVMNGAGRSRLPGSTR